MYLSKLLLQITSPGVRQSLRNCQDMHRTLMQAFDCSRKEASLLYRLFKTKESLYIFVQSIACPHWERIESKGYQCIKMQDISPLTEVFQDRILLRFSLFAYPSKKVSNNGKNSRRILLRDKEERMEWLKNQGKKYGFLLIEAHEAGKEQVISGTKMSGNFFLAGVPFDGVLQITNAELFRDAFQRGIGAEKAYGFGMLMVSKVSI